jgi:hypothetical protein
MLIIIMGLSEKIKGLSESKQIEHDYVTVMMQEREAKFDKSTRKALL